MAERRISPNDDNSDDVNLGADLTKVDLARTTEPGPCPRLSRGPGLSR